MEKIYIVLIGTPGLFAAMIRRFIHLKYVHVVLGLDSKLLECYSFGRRNPQIPFFSGFERENMEDVLAKFPGAICKIMEMECTSDQKKQILEIIDHYKINCKRYHYTMVGLPFLIFGIPFHQKRRYTCSQFLGRMLQDCNIRSFDKHFSLITPRDFYEMDDLNVIYEGTLKDFLKNVKNLD